MKIVNSSNFLVRYLLSLFFLLTTLACQNQEIKVNEQHAPTTPPTKTTPPTISKSQQLEEAIKTNDAEKTRLLCQEDPGLGYLTKDDKSILLFAIKMMSSSVAKELVDHCHQPIAVKDSEGNSLLMMALAEAGASIADDVFLKLVALSSASELLQRNNAGETAEDLAKLYLRSSVVAAIKAKLATGSPPQVHISFDNKYASATELNGLMTFTIKMPITQPVFIKNNQAVVDTLEVNTIPYNDFLDVAYVLLPKDHWFARLFLDNPFKGAVPPAPFALPRASIWGKSLANLKEEQNSVLFAIEGPLPTQNLPQITIAEMQIWFPNYQANIIGQGGVGKVYGFSYQGVDYALKENAKEAADLEKLQFTGAVIEIYGAFEFNGKRYMIMKKGLESLNAMIKANNKLSDMELAQFLPKAVFLLQAEKRLGIKNEDIKPANLLMTDTGLRLIDIDTAFTKGYSGSEGEKLAHSLLEGNLLKSLTGGYVALRNYYDHNVTYRKQNIASDEILAYWFEKSCVDDNLLPNCSAIKTYDSFYPLLPFDKLHKLGLENNVYYGDTSGTHDHHLYGPYKTTLPYPQLLNPTTINWKSYFDKKNAIIRKFCKQIKEPNSSTAPEIFFIAIKPTYDAQCTKLGGGQYPLETSFIDENDPAFRTWVIDAFMPTVKLESFKALAPTLDRPKLFEYIIDHEYGTKPTIKDRMHKILKFK